MENTQIPTWLEVAEHVRRYPEGCVAGHFDTTGPITLLTREQLAPLLKQDREGGRPPKEYLRAS